MERGNWNHESKCSQKEVPRIALKQKVSLGSNQVFRYVVVVLEWVVLLDRIFSFHSSNKTCQSLLFHIRDKNQKLLQTTLLSIQATICYTKILETLKQQLEHDAVNRMVADNINMFSQPKENLKIRS